MMTTTIHRKPKDIPYSDYKERCVFKEFPQEFFSEYNYRVKQIKT